MSEELLEFMEGLYEGSSRADLLAEINRQDCERDRLVKAINEAVEHLRNQESTSAIIILLRAFIPE
jgi:hypothetical protein